MADFSQIPNFLPKVIFFIHTLFFSMATTGYWAPTGYIFYNVLIIYLLFHVIISDNYEILKLALVLNGASILLDIFIVAAHFRNIFPGIIAIIFLLIKPATAYVMYKLARDRSESPDAAGVRSVRDIFTTDRSTYEDIDRTAAAAGAGPVPTPNRGGYDVSTAQQI